MSAISYHDKRFTLASNSGPGDAKPGSTTFHFRQSGCLVWATYSGGAIELGTFIGKADQQGRLELRFQQITSAGEFKAGTGESIPEILPDGRLSLRERWRFTSGDDRSGEAVFIEIPAKDTSKDLQAAFTRGQTFQEFARSRLCHLQETLDQYAQFALTPVLRYELKQSAAKIGPLRALVITEDWCPDCVLNLPVLAHVAEAMGNLDLRVVRRPDVHDLANRFPGPDGKSHIPTVVFFRNGGEQIGTWIERPASAHRWLKQFLGKYPIPPLEFVNNLPSPELHAWMKLRTADERGPYLQEFCWDAIREWKTILFQGETP